jgi:hypothetical protein
MAYQVDRFNGTFLVSVDDGTIDTTTDIRFVGKNYAGYGEVQNENFLHLLENFSNTTAPPKVVIGQIWYDSGSKKLKFYDGSKFRVAGGAEVSSNAPSGLMEGEFWWDRSAQQLYAYNGTEYVLVGPEAPPDLGASAIVSQIVKDTNNVNHNIGKLQSGGDVIAIISKDEFTLNSAVNPITGFSVIKKGLTLVNTGNATGVTLSDHYFWGTASNSLRLGGFLAEDFIRLSNAIFTTPVSFSDSGFTVGDQNDLRIRVENGDEPIIENQLGNSITMSIRVSPTDRRNVAVFTPTAVVPGIDGFYSLGSTSSKWTNVYATTFTGNLVGNVSGSISGNHTGNLLANDLTILVNSSTKTFFGTVGSPSSLSTMYGNLLGDVNGTATNALTLNNLSGALTATASTVALRDASANITANRFIGIADTATRLKIDDGASDDISSSFKSAKTTATGSTIAARKSNGNLVANIFEGTATAARYADLAEKYLADRDYETGTVVTVGGEKEVRQAIEGDLAIGVVSANPAFMMNKDLEGGTYIALKGRVPVKVVGPVKKGDRMVAANEGCAKSADFHLFVDQFAVSLETNDDPGIKLVECLIL